MSQADTPWIGLSGAIPLQAELEQHNWGELGIRIAVTRLVERVLDAGGSIALGSHPTFVPLVETVARPRTEPGKPKRVRMYVARFFLPTEAEQRAFEDLQGEFAEVHWIEGVAPPGMDPARKSEMRQAVLTELREALVGGCRALVCVGGRPPRPGERAGVEEEAAIAVDRQIPLYLVGAGGGYAKTLYEDRYQADQAALSNGLDKDDNDTLATDPDPWMATTLVLEGLARRGVLPPP